MNKTILTGRTTKDIELRTTQSGTSVVRFSLAVQRKKKDDGADFISCVAYGKIAEVIDRYIHKGDKIGLSGHIQTGSYEKNGTKVYTTDVIVDELEFLEGKKAESQQDDFTPIDDTGEDLPF